MPIPPILADQVVKWNVRTTGNLSRTAVPLIPPNAMLINLGVGNPAKVANLVDRICNSPVQGVPCLEPMHKISAAAFTGIGPQTTVRALITIVTQNAVVA